MYNNYYYYYECTIGLAVAQCANPRHVCHHGMTTKVNNILSFLYNNNLKMYGKHDPFVQTVRCGNETPRLTFLWPYFSHTGNFLACLHACTCTHKWYMYMYAKWYIIYMYIYMCCGCEDSPFLDLSLIRVFHHERCVSWWCGGGGRGGGRGNFFKGRMRFSIIIKIEKFKPYVVCECACVRVATCTCTYM